MTASVVVLMATYNGARWLDAQLNSVTEQQGVEVKIVVSDDQSSDATPEILETWARNTSLQILPESAERFGNANRNFMRLLREAPLLNCDYACLSDQDDIWLPGKLERAITRLAETGADAYSSDVTAFWDDGREHIIIKSQPQRPFDHLFESAGPGCTFVFTASALLQLRAWAKAREDLLAGVRVHDWAIYAFGREKGWRWLIDDVPGLRYRQHASNEIGANVGLTSALRRLDYLISGQYRDDVLKIARVSDHRSRALERLTRLGWADRLALAASVSDFRRKLSDAFVLAGAFLLMRVRPQNISER